MPLAAAAAAVAAVGVVAPPAEGSSEVEVAEAAAASAMAPVPPSFVAWPLVPCPRPWSPGGYCGDWPVGTDCSKMS